MKVKRAQLLETLKAMSVGLSSRELLEQSNAFVFTGNQLITFNGEVKATTKNPIDFDAIVLAEDFLKLLEKFPEEEVDITPREGEIVLTGLRRSAGLKRSVDIHLPFDKVPPPEKWSPIKEGLMTALRQASQACGKDETQILATCVHVTPKLVEASDNRRLYRCKIDTGFPSEVLIPSEQVSALQAVSISQVSVTNSWLHFQSKEGITLSVRCYQASYHKGIDELLKIEGDNLELPTNLEEILERAMVMNEGGLDSAVDVSFREGEVEVMSRKATGWFRERKRSSYSGKELSFQCHPGFLRELCGMTRNVITNRKFLKVTTENIEFLVSLRMESPKAVEAEE